MGNLKKYNGKEIIKKEEGFGIDVMLYNLNEYIDGLNKDKKLTNSLVFGVIKSVIEDFRKEYYKTIGIDISEDKEEDVSVNRVRYFDKYLNGEEERRKDVFNCILSYIYDNEVYKEYASERKFRIITELCNEYFGKINIGKKTQEQQEVYFEENEESLKSKSSSSKNYTSVIEDMGKVVVNQVNSRSSSPVSGF